MAKGIVGYGCAGTVKIGAVLLNCPAWDVPDPSGLWITGDVRGSDRLIPGAAGVLPFRRRRTVTEYTLDMVIVGMVDETGAEYEDALAGLELNLETLRVGVVEPTNTGNGTRAAVLTLPSGLTRTADVHVLGLDTGSLAVRRVDGIATHARLLGSLTISVPAGRFT